MGFKWPRTPSIFLPLSLLLPLLLLMGCGSTAPSTPIPTSPPAAAPVGGDTPVPTATPAPATDGQTVLTDKSLHMAITPMPQDTFLPWKASQSGHLVFRPIFENLTTMDPRTGVSEILPQLATDWEMSADGKTWTFKLREGIPFHFDWGSSPSKT
jgi:ABC-type transport system substrate-binding protein